MCEENDFRKFYSKAYQYCDLLLAKFSNNKEAICYARLNIPKSELKEYYVLGMLTESEIFILKTQTKLIKLSIDSMIKNIIEHVDLKYDDYLKLENIILAPDKIIQDRKNNLRMFKCINGKFYEIVIKTTKNKNENYLTTFHRCNISKLKDKKR